MTDDELQKIKQGFKGDDPVLNWLVKNLKGVFNWYGEGLEMFKEYWNEHWPQVKEKYLTGGIDTPELAQAFSEAKQMVLEEQTPDLAGGSEDYENPDTDLAGAHKAGSASDIESTQRTHWSSPMSETYASIETPSATETPSAMEPTSTLDVASDERPIADTEDFWKSYTTADRVLYTEDGIEPMQGEDVNALKNGLLKLGYNVDTSNPIYDEETAKTVYQFQTDHGLTKDGEAGKQTFGKMKELLDKSSQGGQ